MGKKKPTRPFPVEEVRPVAAAFGGSLVFNPFARIPPSLWYGVEIELDQIDLGGGRFADTDLIVGGLVLPGRDWQTLSGTFGPMTDVGVSSIELLGIQHSVDVHKVVVERQRARLFRLTLDLTVNFEAEGTGYQDADLSVTVEGEHHGLFFHEPEWEAEEVDVPAEWQVPERFDQDSVLGLFERFVDTSRYDFAQDGPAFHLVPRES